MSELRDQCVEAGARALEEASGPAGYRVTDQLWERYCEITPDKVDRLRVWASAALDAVLGVVNREGWDWQDISAEELALELARVGQEGTP